MIYMVSQKFIFIYQNSCIKSRFIALNDLISSNWNRPIKYHIFYGVQIF